MANPKKKTGSVPAAACNWTNNNLACVYTWLDLKFIKEIDETFNKSGDITMKRLRFWNETSTPEIRRIEAMAVAAQLAKMFTGLNFAKYEDGKNYALAVEAMINVLVVADKTLCQLSMAVDEIYNFFGEVKA